MNISTGLIREKIRGRRESLLILISEPVEARFRPHIRPNEEQRRQRDRNSDDTQTDNSCLQCQNGSGDGSASSTSEADSKKYRISTSQHSRSTSGDSLGFI